MPQLYTNGLRRRRPVYVCRPECDERFIPQAEVARPRAGDEEPSAITSADWGEALLDMPVAGVDTLDVHHVGFCINAAVPDWG